MLLVERHYLKTWGGSFTENFYGMKRERVLAVDNLSRTTSNVPDLLRERTKLREFDVWKSLFVVVRFLERRPCSYKVRKLDINGYLGV